MAQYKLKCRSVLLLICLLVRFSEGTHVRNSLNDDLLLPYTQSLGHGPSHSHRFVREYQPIIHGNVTYETWTSDKTAALPVVETRIFVSHIGNEDESGKWVYGHLTFINNPLRTVSVLEPGGPGGCGIFLTATVEETAKPRKCLVAQNGGFFDTTTKQCLGNVVSDGKLVQNSGGIQNAQFGIKKDGTLVFGYLSEEDLLDENNPFVQLVSGVVWLLRNGTIYINESMAAEYGDTQKTGSFDTFVNVTSARTAVGHDKDGKLVLFHIEGQTTIRGMNLWETAKFLKDHGVINAINLDGGGSATFVEHGSLASYPSDHCSDNGMWRCPRSVSTVLCVHEPECHPTDCSGHGQCVQGECRCADHWTGPACDTLDCLPSACGPNGVCTQYGCVCDAGWTGSNCSQVCPAGSYGDGCNQTCSCQNGASCDSVHGSCTCAAGFHGDSCEQECPLGFYGQNCKEECRCTNMCPCDPVTGSCNITYKGEKNYTMQRVGHCLAIDMFKSWKQEDATENPKSYFSEKTWITITVVLGLLLLASTVGNLIQISAKSPLYKREIYSYFPLNEMNGNLNHAELNYGGDLTEGMQKQNDSDSE
ncbi:N-acetylglucosamine-1-phosphodiester alpha-N-acetylglucosaminidase isoform X2 [Amia ocellicauda]|uniref:N-acetylglucosamine-1-phosphodiester alpha-N-acetylglucosaminidase isoform X2 n=1 Tax=Amia ocellicauda TaxID=2972642 RepID=UPI0034644A85